MLNNFTWAAILLLCAGLSAGVGAMTTTSSGGSNPVCGNGVLELFEQCDDGNTIDNDGCTSACREEFGATCVTPGQPCTIICGDSLQHNSEQCDVGPAPSPGCTDCIIDVGYTCLPLVQAAPSVCYSNATFDLEALIGATNDVYVLASLPMPVLATWTNNRTNIAVVTLFLDAMLDILEANISVAAGNMGPVLTAVVGVLDQAGPALPTEIWLRSLNTVTLLVAFPFQSNSDFDSALDMMQLIINFISANAANATVLSQFRAVILGMPDNFERICFNAVTAMTGATGARSQVASGTRPAFTCTAVGSSLTTDLNTQLALAADGDFSFSLGSSVSGADQILGAFVSWEPFPPLLYDVERDLATRRISEPVASAWFGTAVPNAMTGRTPTSLRFPVGGSSQASFEFKFATPLRLNGQPFTQQQLTVAVEQGIVSCVFWKNQTLWSSEGCFVSSATLTEITCRTNHLTDFSVLVSGEPVDDTDYGSSSSSRTTKLALAIALPISACVAILVIIAITMALLFTYRGRMLTRPSLTRSQSDAERIVL